MGPGASFRDLFSDRFFNGFLMDFGSSFDLLLHVFSCLLHHFFEHDFYMDFSPIVARLLDR